MKKIIISTSIFLLTATLGVQAQSVSNSIYFLPEWSKRHTLNAAFAPEFGYFSLPVMGGMGLNVKTGLGLSNLVYPHGSEYVTFMHNSVSADEFLNSLDPVTSVSQGLSLDILSFGFFLKDKGRSFLSFDLKLKEGLDVHLPKDLFGLMKKGMSGAASKYDLHELAVGVNTSLQLALGYSRDINEQIRVGGAVKVLAGLAAGRIQFDRIDVMLNNDHYAVDAQGAATLYTDLVSVGTDENGYMDFTDIGFALNSLRPAGMGFAFDLGVTYKPIEHLTLAAAVNDLGMMSWRGSSMTRGVATGGVDFDGFTNVDINDVGGSVEAQLEQLKADAMELVQFKPEQAKDNANEFLPFTLNLSAEYSIFNRTNHDISVGLLYQLYDTPLSRMSHDLMASLTFRVFRWLSLAGTCELVNGGYNRFGMALNISPRGFNFFVATDLLVNRLNPQFIPIDRTRMNVMTGMSFSFGK